MVSTASEPTRDPARRVLLDAASGPLHPAARDLLVAALERGWADPGRRYAEAAAARRMLDQARATLAEGLGVRPEEVSFTGSGAQALRLGLTGLRYAARRRGPHVVVSAVEHSALLLTARDAGYSWYAGRSPQGHSVPSPVAVPSSDPTRAPSGAAPAGAPPLARQELAPEELAPVAVDRLGRLDLSAWAAALDRPGVAAAALQAANGEVGTRQPLARARDATRGRGIPLLVDATSTLGRDPVPTDYDVLAGDARSWAGPPGVGVLVVPARTRWRRPGPWTPAEGGRTDDDPVVPLVLAAAEAWRHAAADRAAEAADAHALIGTIRAAAAAIPDTEVVGDPEDRLPHVSTFSCLFVDGEAIVAELDRRGFAVASGSACTTSTLEPSHVLRAMGVLTHGNVRLTLPLRSIAPRRTDQVARFCAALPEAVAAVRGRLGPR